MSGRPESAFHGPNFKVKGNIIQPRIVHAVLTGPGTQRPRHLRPIGIPISVPGRSSSGNGGFLNISRSESRPNRETGVPSPFPGQIGNRGNGNWGFPGMGAPAASLLATVQFFSETDAAAAGPAPGSGRSVGTGTGTQCQPRAICWTVTLAGETAPFTDVGQRGRLHMQQTGRRLLPGRIST